MPDDVDGSAFRLVPIVGKTLQGSLHRNEQQKPLHLVSAWATNCGLSLGQVAVDDKSNEITAIPKLLEMLELAGAIVTIDAMGCQKDIAKKTVDKEAEFVLAVKNNQPNLQAAIETSFVEIDNQDSENTGTRHYVTQEKSRGRNEERDYVIAPVPKELFALKAEWKGLRTIGRVIAKVERDGKQSEEVRYFISSLPPKVKQFAKAVRGHWGIENSLHWVLDVVFGEDASASHSGHAPENFGFLRRFVVSLLKRDSSEGSLRRKRKRAAWSTSFLEKVRRNRSTLVRWPWLMSPSKTFNLSGLSCGFAVIPNRELRQRFQAAARDLVPHPNALGYVACRAAYEGGESWRVALIDYLRGNRDLLEAFSSEQLPQFGISHVEATYLAWIDARCLGARGGASFFDAAGVRLSDGGPFQAPGFVRLNFACPRQTLRDALDRIATAVRSIA